MIKEKHRAKRWLIIIGIVVSLLWLYPFYLIVTNSFKTQSEIFKNILGLPKAFTFENYPIAAQELDLGHSFLNSFLITVIALVVIIVCTSMAAYSLSRNTSKFSTGVYLFFAVGMLIPFQSIMIPLISIFGKMQMLNRTGLIIMYLGMASAQAIFLYYGALQSIPRSLDEAALIDGASKWQIFWKIIFPLLKPTTITVIVLDSLWFWNDYLLPSLVINRPGMYTIPLKMFYFFGTYSKQWALALAALFMAILPIIILYAFLQKYIIKGVADGAVK